MVLLESELRMNMETYLFCVLFFHSISTVSISPDSAFPHPAKTGEWMHWGHSLKAEALTMERVASTAGSVCCVP